MRYKKEHKEETRQQILEAVHKGFRQHGFAGAGVDGLAKDAGVTSGAFYTHFKSKADAFREAIAIGVEQFRHAVEHYQRENDGQWLDKFSNFYLGEKRRCNLGDSCALQSLSSEVSRSDELTRLTFQKELLKAMESFASGLPSVDGKPDLDTTWAALAMLVGGATLARAVQDQELAEQIAKAVKNNITHASVNSSSK